MGAPLSRDAFLSSVGSRAEDDVEIEGLGVVRVRELSGKDRARVLQALLPAAQGGTADLARYQEQLLELGLIDPNDGQPLLDIAGVQKVMDGGASTVEKLVSAVESLSGLGKDAGAAASAEKNSATTDSSSTSSV